VHAKPGVVGVRAGDARGGEQAVGSLFVQLAAAGRTRRSRSTASPRSHSPREGHKRSRRMRRESLEPRGRDPQ
jgi:hypothetical protein